MSESTMPPAAARSPAPHARIATARQRAAWLLLGLMALSVLLAGLGASVGSTGFDSVLRVADDPLAARIVWDIRLPRSLGAWLAGALLGLAGAVAQGLFRNPLADPFLLGSASGASLGVASALALFGVAPATVWLAKLGLTGAAFVGAVLAVLLTLQLARGVQHTLRLLLAGVIVGVVLGAVKDLITLAAPDIIPSMQGFNLGSAGFIGWASCVLMAVAWCVCAAAAWVFSRALDGLSLGEATAVPGPAPPPAPGAWGPAAGPGWRPWRKPG